MPLKNFTDINKNDIWDGENKVYDEGIDSLNSEGVGCWIEETCENSAYDLDEEFKDSMKFIGITEYEHWTGHKGGEDYYRDKLIYELLRVLRERKYTKIVTHNRKGEYGHPRHRALHDILNHLRPELLWQFDKCKERLPSSILFKKRDLLKVYDSQRDVLDWFSPWYEKITKVNK